MNRFCLTWFLCMVAAHCPAIGQTCGPWTRIGAAASFGGATLNGVTHGDGAYVAVGDDGVIVTGSDGLAWTSRASGTTADLHGVAWGDGRFVAVGDDGTIRLSDDAASWRAAVSDTTARLSAVTWSGTGFLAVGDGSTILTSPDGEAGGAGATEGVAFPEYWSLHAVTCGGGTCLAGGCFEQTSQPAGTVLRSIAGSA